MEKINRSGQNDQKSLQEKEELLTDLDPVKWLTQSEHLCLIFQDDQFTDFRIRFHITNYKLHLEIIEQSALWRKNQYFKHNAHGRALHPSDPQFFNVFQVQSVSEVVSPQVRDALFTG